MADEMSMLKKMKNRISDEVNSATNRLQGIPIIDQLTTNLSHQVNGARNTSSDDLIPDLPLPELSLVTNHRATVGIRQLDTGEIMTPGTECDDELDSKSSPQHQLFDGRSIKQIRKHKPACDESKNQDKDKNIVIDLNQLDSELDDDADDDDKMGESAQSTRPKDPIAHYKMRYRHLVHGVRKLENDHEAEKAKLVKQVSEQKSRLESLQKELNNIKQYQSINQESSTLSASSSQSEIIDKSLTSDGRSSPHQSSGSNSKQIRKIKDLERLIAKCKDSLKAKNSQIQILKDSLIRVEQYRGLMDEVKSDLVELKKSYESWTVLIAESKRSMHQELEDKVIEMEKYKSEMRDLQIQLRDQTGKLVQFKTSIQKLESRLVSTSAAHQKERESLIKELNAAKNNALKQQQKDHELQTERIKLDLEKSIEALKLELLNKDEQLIKNAQRLQELHEQNQKRQIDLNKTKSDLDISNKNLEETKTSNANLLRENQELKELMKSFEGSGSQEGSCDDLVIRLKESEKELKEYKTKCNRLEEQNILLDSVKTDSNNLSNNLRELEQQYQNKTTELEELKSTIDERSEKEQTRNAHLKDEVTALNQKIIQLDAEIESLTQSLAEAKSNEMKQPDNCLACEDLKKESAKITEHYEQMLHELNGRLDLMTTANNDQEKAICELEYNYEGAINSLQTLKSEFDESVKKNESLLQVIQDNESEMQQLQDQLDKLTVQNNDLENLKKESTALTSHINQLKQELVDKNSDLKETKQELDRAKQRILDLGKNVKTNLESIETIRNERDALSVELSESRKKQDEFNKQILVGIVSAINHLETLETSPGSEKVFIKHDDHDDKSEEDNGDWSQDEEAKSSGEPDLLRLIKKLTSLAYHREINLQNSLHQFKSMQSDHSLMSDELQRLKDEINSLNHERSQEIQCSLDENERLKTENQALVHDQKAYDDHVASLEAEIQSLVAKMNDMQLAFEQSKIEVTHAKPDTQDAQTEAPDDDGREQDDLEARYEELDELLRSKEEEIRNLRTIISDNQEKAANEEHHQEIAASPSTPNVLQDSMANSYVPDSTEFEYLRNIVYQFMVGREPLTLARVISAVFKFDKNQVDQICKIQEAIHQISG